MTEHKFTDEEIIKALEHCESGCSSEACIGCPFDEKGVCIEAENALAIFALDLINRQKAEVAFWMDATANAKKEAVKAFGERLKERLIEGGIYPVLVKNSINDLVKEMTEA